MAEKENIMRQELDDEALDNVAGGRAKQNNSKNKGAQQNTQTGNNYTKIMQTNEIKNNSGNVKVGSPVSIEQGNNSTPTINIG